MDAAEWQDLTSRFRDHLVAERGLAPLTVRNYLSDIAPLHDFMSEREIESFADLDRRRVRAYLAWLQEIGYVRSSVSRKLSALRTLFKWLNRMGIVERDPLPARGAFKLDSRLPRFLSENEAAKLVSAPDATSDKSVRDKALLELVYATGLRVSEVSGLNLDSINLNTRELMVTGKGSKDRVVLMGQPAADAIRIYLSEVRNKVGPVAPEDALFVNRYGGTSQRPQHSEDSARVRRARRHCRQCAYSHSATLFRHPYAGGRRGPALSAGTLGTRQSRDNSDIYPRNRKRGETGVYVRAPEIGGRGYA